MVRPARWTTLQGGRMAVKGSNLRPRDYELPTGLLSLSPHPVKSSSVTGIPSVIGGARSRQASTTPSRTPARSSARSRYFTTSSQDGPTALVRRWVHLCETHQEGGGGHGQIARPVRPRIATVRGFDAATLDTHRPVGLRPGENESKGLAPRGNGRPRHVRDSLILDPARPIRNVWLHSLLPSGGELCLPSETGVREKTCSEEISEKGNYGSDPSSTRHLYTPD